MTVIVIVACLVIAGAELYLARGAHRVSNRLQRLEALTLVQDERIESMNARLKHAGPDTRADHAGTGLIEVADGTAGLRERLSALEDARRVDRNLYARLDGAVDSLERLVADVFRLTVSELDQAAARTLGGPPADPDEHSDPAPDADTIELGRGEGRRTRRGVTVALTATAGVLLGAAALTGGAVLAEIQRLLSAYSGVLALAASTLAVVAGLAATGRVLLSIRHRILTQAVHRAATLVAIGFLAAHVVTAVLTRHAEAVQVVLPVGRTRSIAVGTVAAQLMVFVAVTGLARGRFAVGRRPGLWRAAHRLAYVGWSLAILHGLLAGRHPAAWVTWSYVVCLVTVGVALLTRGFVIMRSRGAEAGGSRPRPGPGGRISARRAPELHMRVPR